MVGIMALNHAMEVRLLPSQPICKVCVFRLARGFA